MNKLYAIIFTLLMLLSCCEKGNNIIPAPIDPEENTEDNVKTDNNRTVFMYFPWSVNLYSAFKQNIDDMEVSIKENGLQGSRVVVFIYKSEKEAEMFEIILKEKNGKRTIERKQIQKYTGNTQTTISGTYYLLKKVIEYAPAKEYAMTIGCHGMSWVPSGVSPRWHVSGTRLFSVQNKWEDDYKGRYFHIPTRWFGGGSTGEFHIDVSTLVEAIKLTKKKMKYILFDDCYMVSAETAFDLREVTDYIIGSPCEILFYGLPYHKMGKYLLSGENYQAICDEFYKFYSTYVLDGELSPYGTISVIKTSEMINLANVVKEINKKYNTLTKTVQRLDGYTPIIFHDFGSYFESLCGDDIALLNKLRRQLNYTVPYRTNTKEYYSRVASRPFILHHYSGMTISDATTHPDVEPYKYNTNWYKYTHE